MMETITRKENTIIIKYAKLADYHEICPYILLLKILRPLISELELTFFRNAFVL